MNYCAPFVILLFVLAAGCTVIIAGRETPQQMESPKVVQPMCIVGCSSQAAATQSQGARIDGAAGAVSISKPITETLSDSHNRTEKAGN